MVKVLTRDFQFAAFPVRKISRSFGKAEKSFSCIFNRKAEIYIRLILLFGVCMPYYILLSNLTDEGWKTVREKPERIKEVNRELEAFGVRVIRQYAVLGPYDFVNIVEAPDNETIAKVSIELGFRGTIKILSMAAIPIDEFITSVKKS